MNMVPQFLVPQQTITLYRWFPTRFNHSLNKKKKKVFILKILKLAILSLNSQATTYLTQTRVLYLLSK